MNTVWILIIFWGLDASGAGKSMAVAEFASEKACKAAIAPATTAVKYTTAICVPKEIK